MGNDGDLDGNTLCGGSCLTTTMAVKWLAGMDQALSAGQKDGLGGVEADSMRCLSHTLWNSRRMDTRASIISRIFLKILLDC